MVGEREKFMLQKNLSHLGKKGTFYSSPQKLAVGAYPDWRLRPGLEIPARLRAPSELGTRGAPHIGSSGQTGDSGPEGPETPDKLRCSSKPLSSVAPHFEIFGAEAGTPETPVIRGRRCRPDRRLRSFSGLPPDRCPEAHHTWPKSREKRGSEISGPMDRRLRTISSVSPNQIQTEKPELP